jgi:hypothetical protein
MGARVELKQGSRKKPSIARALPWKQLRKHGRKQIPHVLYMNRVALFRLTTIFRLFVSRSRLDYTRISVCANRTSGTRRRQNSLTRSLCKACAYLSLDLYSHGYFRTTDRNCANPWLTRRIRLDMQFPGRIAVLITEYALPARCFVSMRHFRPRGNRSEMSRNLHP